MGKVQGTKKERIFSLLFNGKQCVTTGKQIQEEYKAAADILAFTEPKDEAKYKEICKFRFISSEI